MKRLITSLLIVLLGGAQVLAQSAKYEPTWESIDSRPTPQWFPDAKFGIFVHWGVYSVPAWGPKGKYSEWYWNDMQNKDGETWKHHVRLYGENFKYQDFAPMFKAELYDPDAWAKIFKASGAKYVVLTSKHHEGFCMWPSPDSWNWNSVDIGPHRDLAGELIKAVREQGLKAGFYYSLYEWFNPIYRSDVARYVDQHMLPQMKDLVTRYKPDILWGDGEWDYTPDVWHSCEFLAWLFNESPVKDDVAINDRWGKGTRSKHGGFYTTEYFKYADMEKIGHEHPWEECRGMGASFGYNRNEDVDDYKSADELIELLIGIVARGGNLLLDIGPTADGRIPVIMQERLKQIGAWLAINGEAIYVARPWRVMSEGDRLYYTAKGNTVYAIALDWPGKTLTLKSPKPTESLRAALLGHEGELNAKPTSEGIEIELPDRPDDLKHAWAIKLEGVQ